MKAAVFIRAGSMSPRTEIGGKFSAAGGHEASVCFYRRSRSTKMSFDMKDMRDLPSPARTSTNPLRRVRSDTDLLRSAPFESRWSPTVILSEEEEVSDLLMSAVPAAAEELEYSGGGMGNGRKIGGGRGGGNSEGDRGIGNYYQEMLKADPGNPLLLRNYAKFLHEVEGDWKSAEVYYGRAILASPDDGELLSLYGGLIWESQRDCKRAESYYERAVEACPNDCYVMGSYAHFLWDAEEEEEGEEGRPASSSPFVEAY